MKKKKLATIGSLSALCIAVLAGVYLLNREPENSFIPAGSDTGSTTDTWTDNTENSLFVPTYVETKSIQTKGSTSDQTQTVISEDENGSVTSLSDSTTRSEAEEEKPQEKPTTTDDTKDKDKQPEYETTPVAEDNKDGNPADESGSGTENQPSSDPSPQTPATDNGNSSEPERAPSDAPTGTPNPENDHPNQIYDPVFGWLDVGTTTQDTIDSDGDINKQIGIMGGN